MPQEVIINQKSAIDFDDRIGSVNNLATTTGNKIAWADTGLTYFRTRTGQRARLVFIGNAVDPGGESKVTFHIRVNGTLMQSPFDSFQQAMGETYNGWARMGVAIDLPQNAMIEVLTDNSDSTAYNSYARLRVEYESLN